MHSAMFKRKHLIDQRPLAGFVEEIHHRVPRGVGFFVRVFTDGHATDFQSAEE